MPSPPGPRQKSKIKGHVFRPARLGVALASAASLKGQPVAAKA